MRALFRIHTIGTTVAASLGTVLVAIAGRGSDDPAAISGVLSGAFLLLEFLIAGPLLVGVLWLASVVVCQPKAGLSRAAITALEIALLSLVAAQALWLSGNLIGAVYAGEGDGSQAMLVFQYRELFAKLLLPVGAAWAVTTKWMGRRTDARKSG